MTPSELARLPRWLRPAAYAVRSCSCFGPEASIFAILIGVLASVWLLRRRSSEAR
ncbi:MAG TPA: hypothetical protein VGD29_06580 [Actinoplanes sp.]|jgi:hypothetical protein